MVRDGLIKVKVDTKGIESFEFNYDKEQEWKEAIEETEGEKEIKFVKNLLRVLLPLIAILIVGFIAGFAAGFIVCFFFWV